MLPFKLNKLILKMLMQTSGGEKKRDSSGQVLIQLDSYQKIISFMNYTSAL